MGGGGLVFVLAMAAWASVREVIGISEIQRRIMWASAIGLCALPAWMGWAQAELVQSVLWPFLAGVMVGELAWLRFHRWRIRRARNARERLGEGQETPGGAPEE